MQLEQSGNNTQFSNTDKTKIDGTTMSTGQHKTHFSGQRVHHYTITEVIVMMIIVIYRFDNNIFCCLVRELSLCMQWACAWERWPWQSRSAFTRSGGNSSLLTRGQQPTSPEYTVKHSS